MYSDFIRRKQSRVTAQPGARVEFSVEGVGTLTFSAVRRLGVGVRMMGGSVDKSRLDWFMCGRPLLGKGEFDALI